MAELPATRLLSPPPTGRTFSTDRIVRLGDVDVGGELRLDSTARYLQDVATDDALGAGLGNPMGWLVRRTLVRVESPARLNERISLTTYCTGIGRSWAERRTTIRGCDGSAAIIDAVSLWVQVDLESGRPSRLSDDFDGIYAGAAGGRQVSSRLSLPKPPDGAEREPWNFRLTDLDPFGHVNNAAQWAVMEELLARSHAPRRGSGEIEFLNPAELTAELVVDESTGWLTAAGKVTTALRWSLGSCQAQTDQVDR